MLVISRIRPRFHFRAWVGKSGCLACRTAAPLAFVFPGAYSYNPRLPQPLAVGPCRPSFPPHLFFLSILVSSPSRHSFPLSKSTQRIHPSTVLHFLLCYVQKFCFFTFFRCLHRAGLPYYGWFISANLPPISISTPLPRANPPIQQTYRQHSRRCFLMHKNIHPR